MASRNIVIKNNTRCFKSALQQSLNFSFLIFFIPFLPFILVPLAIATINATAKRVVSSTIDTTTCTCNLLPSRSVSAPESGGSSHMKVMGMQILVSLRVIILTPKRIAQGCVQRRNLTYKKQMPSYCVGVSPEPHLNWSPLGSNSKPLMIIPGSSKWEYPPPPSHPGLSSPSHKKKKKQLKYRQTREGLS